MELSIMLMQQIGSLFIMMGIGFILVRKKICKKDDSKLLSTLLLYVAAPCAIIKSFQIERTETKMQGLLLAVIAAIIVHIIFISMSYVLGRTLRFNAIEKACIIYSNCGNLIIPLVTIMLGPEMTFYTSGYMIVQNNLMWTHCKYIISEESTFNIRKILFSFNIIAIIIGLVIFYFQISVPIVISSAVSSLTNLMGPLSMIVVGMLLSNIDLKEVFSKKRAYLVSGLRLIILPAIVLFIFIVLDLSSFVSNGKEILLVSLLAASAPSASTVTNFAQLYNNKPEDASIINAMSVLLCIITMPTIMMLYSYII
ncbi:MAG: AEC family transporter [Coprobacillaceae bacterium]